MNPEMATTWWSTGLPGSGKTTFVHAFARALRLRGRAVCIAGGDELRTGLCKDLGLGEARRAENVRCAAHRAQRLNANAVHAVVAMVSPSMQARAAAYATIGVAHCKEIHISTPLEACAQHDPKGLYARARAHQLTQMTGVQAHYESRASPVLRIETSQTALHAAVQQLLQA